MAAANSTDRVALRLKLVVRRHELPDVRLLFGLKPMALSISDFLALVDERVPLVSNGWRLQDYLVTVGSFEALHYSDVGSVLKNNDEVIVRPLLPNEYVDQETSGRRTAAEDKVLIDGVAFGQPLRGLPHRCDICIPARKRTWAEYQSEASIDEEETRTEPRSKRPRFESQLIGEAPSGSSLSNDQSASAIKKSRIDECLKPTSLNQVRRIDTRAEVPQETDEKSAHFSHASLVPTRQISCSKPSTVAPGDGLRRTKARRQRKKNQASREAARGYALAITGGSGYVESGDCTERLQDVGLWRKMTELSTQQPKLQWTIDCMATNSLVDMRLTKAFLGFIHQIRFQQAQSLENYPLFEIPDGIDIPPEFCLTPPDSPPQQEQPQTSVANQQEEVSSSDQCDEGHQPEVAPPSIHFDEDSEAVPKPPHTDASTESQRARLDIGAANRMIYSKLGSRTPKNTLERDKINQKIWDCRTRSPKKAPDRVIFNGLLTAGHEAWRSCIDLYEVECVDGDRFPRDDQSYHDESTQAYDKAFVDDGEAEYHAEELDNGVNDEYLEHLEEDDSDEQEADSDSEEDEDDCDGSGSVNEGWNEQNENNTANEDLPLPPDNIEEHPTLTPTDYLLNAIIVFKRFEVSKATGWSPGLSPFRVAKIVGLGEQGHLVLELAKRDQKPNNVTYNEKGSRLYEGFEMPGADEADGVVDASPDDFVEPKLLQAGEPGIGFVVEGVDGS